YPSALAEEPATLGGRTIGEAEALHRAVANELDGLLWRIGHESAVDVGGVDGALCQERVAHERHHRLPVALAHEHHREVTHLARLDLDRGLEDLVQRPDAARHRGERVRVLEEHELPDEEV